VNRFAEGRDHLSSGGPKRVLLIEANEDGTVGGSHRCLHDIAVHLDKTRYSAVCLFYQANWIGERLQDAGIDVRNWDDIRRRERQLQGRRHLAHRIVARLAIIATRVRFLRREHIRLVHLNNSPITADLDWLPAALLAGVPIIAHARGPIYVRLSRKLLILYRGYRRIIAISGMVRDSLLAAGFAPSQVLLVYDGIDVDTVIASSRAHPRIRVELGGEGDRMVLGVMAGHLKEWKGQALVIEALTMLPEEQRSRLRFVFVGGSPKNDEYSARLETLVAESRLTDNVRFLGERQDVPAIMAAADFVVHASLAPEPFGLVVVEAMALGKPVIAPQAGGPAETVAPGSGLLFRPGCAHDLAQQIERIIDDPQLRSRLAEVARERARHFDISRNVANIERVYEAVLSSATPRRAS
jgi:glycosyltransferase involved in cell wall biosynthesis